MLAGDRDAFRELVDRHKERVYSVAFRLLGNQTEAEDLTQQSFVEAFVALPSFTPGRNFGSWLMRIAVNNCKDHLKSHKRRESQLDQPVEGKQAMFSGLIQNPEQAAASGEMGALVAAALERMDAKYRVPLVLKDVEGFTYKEIQQVLDLNLPTLKSRVLRARAKLQGALTWTKKS